MYIYLLFNNKIKEEIKRIVLNKEILLKLNI